MGFVKGGRTLEANEPTRCQYEPAMLAAALLMS
jgi:hypothetical protein